jgi:hypothetical protein
MMKRIVLITTSTAAVINSVVCRILSSFIVMVADHQNYGITDASGCLQPQNFTMIEFVF